MRKPIIAGNWKMYKTLSEATELASGLKDKLKKHAFDKGEVVLCPPYTALTTVAATIKGSHVGLGAQDVFWEEQGAFTGEISPVMLRSFDCEYVIIGHSERRRYFAENNHEINLKIIAALKNGLKPILCVGETKRDHDDGKERRVVLEQLEICLAGVPITKAKGMIIAYEPIWAIGTGNSADVEEIVTMHTVIKKWLAKEYPNLATRKKIHLIYGGSVDSRNITSYLRENSIDGALVGGASVKAKEFFAMIDAVVSLKL